ncbi:MAG: segregation/condensation protein A [Acidimicrobiia bacterium]
MAYEVRTAVFEGPLDLLLQLITRSQVDVAEVDLADVVTEYLAHLEAMAALDLEVTSEFLLIAATLIQLKARRLLPDDVELDLDEELALMEERDRLLGRLLACVTFKDVAAVLAIRIRDGARHATRTLGITDEVAADLPVEVRLGTDAAGLAAIARRVIDRPRDPDLDHLDLDLPSVELAMEDLRQRVEEAAETTFSDVVARCSRKVEVVAYFLALLELARWGMLELHQPTWDDEIMIRHVPDGEPA